MKHLHATLIVTILLTIFCAGGAMSGNSPSIEFRAINSYEALDFTSVNDGWMDPTAKFEEELHELFRADGNHKPTKAELLMLRGGVSSTDKYKLLGKLSTETNVILRIGIMMPNDIKLKINGPGAFKVQLKRRDGRMIDIADAGLICPFTITPMKEWLDSKSSQIIILDNSFSKGRPGGWPVMIYLRMPRSLLGSEIVMISPTDKLEIVYPQQTVIFK